MPCYRPITAYAPLSQADGGRYVFDKAKALNPDHPRQLPCGKCNGCKQEVAESWAIRAYHESTMHEANSFLTLTYADEHLPLTSPSTSAMFNCSSRSSASNTARVS